MVGVDALVNDGRVRPSAPTLHLSVSSVSPYVDGLVHSVGPKNNRPYLRPTLV